MSLGDFIIRLRFFVPSELLTKEIIELNAMFLEEAGVSSHPKRRWRFWGRQRVIAQQQRTIAERLYRYLASVARNYEPADRVSVWHCIPQGMAAMLGFPTFDELNSASEVGRRTIVALEQLAVEFCAWLIKQPQGVYCAPWGELRMIDNDHLNLRAKTKTQEIVTPAKFAETNASVGEVSLTGTYSIT